MDDEEELKEDSFKIGDVDDESIDLDIPADLDIIDPDEDDPEDRYH